MKKTIKAINVYIAGRIETVRENDKMTQQALADLLDISRCSIVNIEAGRQALSIDKLIDLSIIFNKEILCFLPSKSWYQENKNKKAKKVITYIIED